MNAEMDNKRKQWQPKQPVPNWRCRRRRLKRNIRTTTKADLTALPKNENAKTQKSDPARCREPGTNPNRHEIRHRRAKVNWAVMPTRNYEVDPKAFKNCFLFVTLLNLRTPKLPIPRILWRIPPRLQCHQHQYYGHPATRIRIAVKKPLPMTRY